MFREEVLKHLRRQFVLEDAEDGPSQFLVNGAMWTMFMNSYMVAAVHLDKHGDQSQRVLRNMDAESMQRVFTATLNQGQSHQKRGLYGLQDQLDWTEGPWKSRTLIEVVADICKQK